MTVEITTPKLAVRKNNGLWLRVLPEIADWLRVNHLSSATDAERHFGITAMTLAKQLEVQYPGEFDFTERRRLRGIANKPVVKNPRTKKVKAIDLATQMSEVLKAFDAVIDKLAGVETAILLLSEAEKK